MKKCISRSVESIRFFQHLERFHCNEPSFKVLCKCCPKSFTKINSLQRHYCREHKILHVEEVINVQDEGNGNMFEENLEEETARSDMQHHAAKFHLRAKGKGKLTQSALEMVEDSTKNLFGRYLCIVKISLVAKITGNFGQELELTYTLLLYVSLVFGQNILTPKLACQYTAEGTS